MWYLLGWIPLGLPVVLLLGWVVTRGRSRSGPRLGRSRHNVDAHSDPAVSQVAHASSAAALPMRDRSFDKPRPRGDFA